MRELGMVSYYENLDATRHQGLRDNQVNQE